MAQKISNTNLQISSEIKVVYTLQKLFLRERVNYETIYEQFECSKRTMDRIIASIRNILDTTSLFYDFELIFNRKRNSYELIRIGLKSSLQFII